MATIPLQRAKTLPLAALLLVIAACSGSAPLDLEAYQAEVEAWQQEYLADLTAPVGWLTLAGLLWLEPGDNRFGGGEAADLRLEHPALPPLAAIFTLDDGRVSFIADESAEFTVDGQPFSAGTLEVDVVGSPATELRIGQLHIIVIERGDRIGLRVRDFEHPARTGFPGLDFYPVDPTWRIEGEFLPHPEGTTIQVMDVTGTIREFDNPGRVSFEMRGQTYTLEALDESSTERLFLMFRDGTSGNATYGAGRYLYTDYPDGRGRVLLDFNKAHNPPCAYTRHAVCPLPPRGNEIPLRVTAGERDFFGNGY